MWWMRWDIQQMGQRIELAFSALCTSPCMLSEWVFSLLLSVSLYLMIALWRMERALADCNRLFLFLNRFSEKSPVSRVACHLSEANSTLILPARPDLVPHTMILHQSLILWCIAKSWKLQGWNNKTYVASERQISVVITLWPAYIKIKVIWAVFKFLRVTLFFFCSLKLSGRSVWGKASSVFRHLWEGHFTVTSLLSR